MNNNFKQAQLNHDNQLPPDTTEQDELIEVMAEDLIRYEVIDHPVEGYEYLYLDQLTTWMKNAEYKSIRIQSKINSYKELQLELCKCMIADILNKGE